MQLPILALSLAAAAPVALAAPAAQAAEAYPITGSDVNCRSGPSTSSDSVKTYDEGDDVKISCQTAGETIEGNYLWDKTSDGCYVADYYVKTGSDDMVTDQCDGGGGDGNSTTNGDISREEIMSRGQYWIDRHVPYDMGGSYPDPQGTDYRTDCSGFVSMALHTSPPGYSTVSLPEVAVEIDWDDLQAGDFVGTLGDGTGYSNGHVTLFHSWTDDTQERYNTLECRGTDYGCVAYEREVGWKDGSFTSKPYKYVNVKE